MSDIQSATARDLSHARSLLFAPGSDERKLANALASEADLVVADLEDAVAPAEKPAAREVVARLDPKVVRVNGADTEWFEDDLALVAGAGARRGRAAEGDPRGGRRAQPVGAASDRDRRDGAGAPARLRDSLRRAGLGAHPRRGRSRRGARPRAAARTGSRSCTPAPASSSTRPRPASARRSTSSTWTSRTTPGSRQHAPSLARSASAGKVCIHPQQVPIVNRAFAPSEREVAWAQRVVDEFEASARAC